MKKSELKKIIFEVLCEHYQDVYRKALLKEDLEKDQNMVYAEGEDVLPDSTDQILAKFPTLKHALIRLQTDQYDEFVSSIDWISPKPSEFRINLKNGQSYTLKWMGKDFEATISGKKYYIGQLPDFQQALNKLSILYKEGPVGTEEDATGEGGDMGGGSDTGGGFSGGGSGNFPGESGEGAPEGAGGSEEAPGEGGEEQSPADMDVDFEADENI